MSKENVFIAIVVALLAIVKLDFILHLSYWNAFQIGVKIVVLASPILICAGIVWGILKWLHTWKKKRAKSKNPSRTKTKGRNSESRKRKV